MGPERAPTFGVPGYGVPTDFLLAPKPGIIPLRPLTVSEIIGGAFAALRANPRAMFLPALLVMGVLGGVSAVLTYALQSATLINLDGRTTQGAAETLLILPALVTLSPSTLIATVVSIVANGLLTGLLIVTVSRAVLGRVASPGQAWAQTRGRIWALLGQALLITLIETVPPAGATLAATALLRQVLGNNTGSSGEVLLVILVILLVLLVWVLITVFLVVRLFLAPAALILENTSVASSIRRSWTLTRGSFWRVLGALVLMGLIAWLVAGAIGIVAGVGASVATVLQPGSATVAASVVMLASTLATALVMPFTASVAALIYIDLRMRKEGLDIELRRAAAQ
jgi:putative membrane protein